MLPLDTIFDVWSELVHAISGVILRIEGAAQDIFDLWLKRSFIKLVIGISVVWSVGTINKNFSRACLCHALFYPVNSGGSWTENFSMIVLAREPAVSFNVVKGNLLFEGFRMS